MTIWVNVTSSAGWKRPPLGIVRVEQRLAEGLRAALGPQRVRLCVWDPDDGCFSAWVGDAASLLDARAEFDDRTQVLGRKPPRGRAEALRSIGRALLDLAPEVLRRPLSALGRPLDRGLAHGRRLASSFRRHAARARRENPDGRGNCLSAGDVLVTLGLDWEAGFTPVLGDLKQRQRFRVIGCCYDVIPIEYPQYCVPGIPDRFTEYLDHLVGYCDRIACISDCTRRDLERVLGTRGLPIPGLFNLPLGTDLPAADGDPSADVAAVAARPFFLFVSTIERRKNHEVLYRAMHRLAERHDPAALPRLVLVGSLGWGVGDLMNDIASDPKTQGLVVPLHRVSDSELRFLYQRALFCVFPSLYEGWGLPVAEALSLGKAVICSDRGPAREVGGDLADYLDPWDLPAWVAAIERFWLEPELLASRAAEVQARYRPPTWADASAVLAAQALALESAGAEPSATADRSSEVGNG